MSFMTDDIWRSMVMEELKKQGIVITDENSDLISDTIYTHYNENGQEAVAEWCVEEIENEIREMTLDVENTLEALNEDKIKGEI